MYDWKGMTDETGSKGPVIGWGDVAGWGDSIFEECKHLDPHELEGTGLCRLGGGHEKTNFRRVFKRVPVVGGAGGLDHSVLGL